MSFEKVVDAELWTVTAQNSTMDSRIGVGTTAANVFTPGVSPLKGSLLWDKCTLIVHDLVVAGGATGGSYTIAVTTDAVVGYTGLPIATEATVGPNSPNTIVLDSLHQSSSCVRPTHLLVTQDAAGGAITFKIHAIAKQYRGVLGTPGAKTSERILQGTMIRGASFTGGQFVSGKGFDSDETITLGTSSSNLGMHRLRLWDAALFWAVAGESASGSHDVDIVGEVHGDTVTIASTGAGGALDAAGEKLAITNNFYGSCINPTAIIWTEVTAGGISDARVVGVAKSGRGSMAKR
jgi:hypothetical protein